MKRFVSSLLALSMLALPSAALASPPLPAGPSTAAKPSSSAPPLSRDERTAQGVLVGGSMVSVTTMIWGFAGWASADSIAAATVGGAVFFGGFGALALTTGCILVPSLCGHVLNAGYDAVRGVAGRIAGVFDRIEHGSVPACPLR